MIREDFARHLRGAVDGGADVTIEMTIDHDGTGLDADPTCLSTGGSDAEPHAELTTGVTSFDPALLAFGAFARQCDRPRCGSDDDGSAVQHKVAESLVGAAQSAVGIGLEDTERQGGKNRIDTVILTD